MARARASKMRRLINRRRLERVVTLPGDGEMVSVEVQPGEVAMVERSSIAEPKQRVLTAEFGRKVFEIRTWDGRPVMILERE